MNEISAQTIINEARKYLGTPYANQGRSRQMLDCGGLLVIVCTNLGITDADISGYANSPDGESFERILSENLDEITPKENVRIGDIIGMDYKDGLQHTAFVSRIDEENGKMVVIHAKRGRGVIEQYLHGYDLRAWAKTYRIRGIKVE